MLLVSLWLVGDVVGIDFFCGIILFVGGSDGLKLEEFEFYSVGFDWMLDFVEDLSVSMIYYNVDYLSVINLVLFYILSVYFNMVGYVVYYMINLMLEEVLVVIEGFCIDGVLVELLYVDGNLVYLLVDVCCYNMIVMCLLGLDFDV